MKLLQELLHLNESVTFGAVKLKMDKGERIWDYTPFEKQEEIDCRDCEDATKPHPSCWFCKGSGKEKIWQNIGPTMNVANHTVDTILTDLGLTHLTGDEGTVGVWEPKQLPEIRRKLVKLKNSDLSKHVEEPSDTRGPMRHYKDEDGQDRIGHGARLIHQGHSLERINSYIDRLLDVIDFAQKHDAAVAWS
jgi:hypothetical protein